MHYDVDFGNYLGWKIYAHKKKCTPPKREELIRNLLSKFQSWNPERINNTIKLTDPVLIYIRFGDFPSPSKQHYSIEIESSPSLHKRGYARDHLNVLKRIYEMLPKWKKESYRNDAKQGLIKVNVRKYSILRKA